MSQSDFQASNPYATFGSAIAADAPADVRLTFIRKTYTHLMAAIYALVALEFLYFTTLPLNDWMPQFMALGGGWGWLIVLGAFMVVSWIADSWARSDTSVGMQYAGLFLYVFAESVILLPLLWIANHFATPIGDSSYNAILVAAVATLGIFGVLTATVFLTRKDFSFLGPILGIAGMLAFGAIILGAFGMFSLGAGFAGLMIAFAAGAILYSTSNVLHHYRTDQYVAASLALFAAVALLFWYVLQIVISLSGRD